MKWENMFGCFIGLPPYWYIRWLKFFQLQTWHSSKIYLHILAWSPHLLFVAAQYCQQWEFTFLTVLKLPNFLDFRVVVTHPHPPFSPVVAFCCAGWYFVFCLWNFIYAKLSLVGSAIATNWNLKHFKYFGPAERQPASRVGVVLLLLNLPNLS